MRYMSAAFILLWALGIGPSYAGDTSPLARIAAERALEAYGRGGMTAIKSASRDCYERDLDKIFCIYVDTAAQQIDRPMADMLKLPRDSYFYGDEFLNRAGPILVTAGLSMQESNEFLRRCYDEVVEALSRDAVKAAAQAGG
jgi:hypothetical protein